MSICQPTVPGLTRTGSGNSPRRRIRQMVATETPISPASSRGRTIGEKLLNLGVRMCMRVILHESIRRPPCRVSSAPLPC